MTFSFLSLHSIILKSSRQSLFGQLHVGFMHFEYRKLYLWKLDILESTHAPPPTCSDDPIRVRQEDDSKKTLVLIYHDESTFHSNDGQGWLWGEAGKQPIRPKGQGCGIMVSDFIEEHNGYLHFTNQEYEQFRTNHSKLWKDTRLLLKYGTGLKTIGIVRKFLVQVKQAVTIAELKYPSSSHNLVSHSMVVLCI